VLLQREGSVIGFARGLGLCGKVAKMQLRVTFRNIWLRPGPAHSLSELETSKAQYIDNKGSGEAPRLRDGRVWGGCIA
jgi:hypothetical protein